MYMIMVETHHEKDVVVDVKGRKEQQSNEDETANDGDNTNHQHRRHNKRHLSKQEREVLKKTKKTKKLKMTMESEIGGRTDTVNSPSSKTSTTATTCLSHQEEKTNSVPESRKGKKKKKKAKNKKEKLETIQDRASDQSENMNKNEDGNNLQVSIGNDHHLDDGDGDEERIRLECMKSYTPIPLPQQHSTEVLTVTSKNNNNSNDTIEDEGGCRTLGKWFPNAILVKSQINYTNTGKLILLPSITTTDPKKDMIHPPSLTEETVRVQDPKSSLVLFYQYTTCGSSVQWDRTKLQTVMSYLTSQARQRHLGGRIRVAPEGVNATISGIDTPWATAQETLRHFAMDLQQTLDPMVFAHTDFKYIDNLPPDRHFKEFKILPVQELVFYDIGEDEAPLAAEDEDNEDYEGGGNESGTKTKERPILQQQQQQGGIHLDAKAYHKMLQRDDAVVIDVRNHYETILGRFDGQQQHQQQQQQESTTGGGAQYIDPQMRKSTDFKSWLSSNETKEKLKDKTVLMYCTGGIRCERASAYLAREMGNDVAGVYQLKGGIERYLKTFKDGGYWRGKNFVFDKREAVGVDNPDGDGGVIRKQDKKKNQSGTVEATPAAVVATCCVCGDPWDRYVGKKKCSTCGVPVLMCDKCMSLKPDKTPGMELKVRCPLCVAEDITVLAKEVEFTANGIKGKIKKQKVDDNNYNVNSLFTTNNNSKEGTTTTLSSNIKGESENSTHKKAAESVLKWGGGHANEKKQLKKMKRRLCQFGTNCIRKDCFFFHPERRQVSG